MNLSKLEGKVELLLIENEETRADDMTLYLEYLNLKGVSLVNTFNSRRYRKDNGISSFESVSRCRRKLQERYPELKPDKKTLELRKEEEKRWREYALDLVGTAEE